MEGGEIDNFGKKREEITTLFVTTNVEGELKLEGFTNLERFELDATNITSLDISDCPKLKLFYTVDGKIGKIDLSKNLDLEIIKIKRWGVKLDLDMFAHLEKIEELNLYGSDFIGSLEALKKCKDLKSLIVAEGNFNLKQGLEFLPESLVLEQKYILNSGIDTVLEPYDGKLEI